MAWQVGSACYGTLEAANTATASAQVGAVVVHGGTAYVVDVSAVTGAAITYELQPVGGGTPITLAASVTPMECGLLDWQDGLSLGWGIAAVWVAVAAVMVMRKGVHE